MSNVLVPILPGQLPQNYCFTSWSKTLVDFANAMQAVLDGATFYNFGPTRPDPQYEGYPWLRTQDGRWYVFSGDWISPNPEPAIGGVRSIWVGALTGAGSLEEYDGGESAAISDRTGPMWERDTDFADRIPIGVGSLTDPSTAGVNAGAATHILTDAEGATGAHTHPIGLFSAGDDIAICKQGVNTVTSYPSRYITGSDGIIDQNLTTADAFTLQANNGAGVTPTPFSILPPVRGVYLIRRTQRIFYRA